VLSGGCISIGIIYLSQQNQKVESNWRSFQAQYSEKARLENSLNSILGYGGMIHHFKNLILRKKKLHQERVDTHLGAVKIILEKYEKLALSNSELTAIDDIRNTLIKYDKASEEVKKDIAKGLSSSEIDKLVKVDDQLALRGLSVLRKENIRHQKSLGSGLNKSLQIGKLRTLLGYGGMIHAIKNYILRNEEKYKKSAQRSLSQALEVIAQYKEMGNISEAESLALEDVKATINLYSAVIDNINLFFSQGKTVEFIDSKVRVDDTLALRGLNLIDKEINRQIDIQAKSVDTAFENIKRINKVLLIAIVILILLLILLNVWIVGRLIGKPIKKMSVAMIDLAYGKLDVQLVGIVGCHEIGQMHKSIKVFRENAVKRIEAERELKQANEELQNQLSELSKMRKRSDEQTVKALSLAEGLASARDEALEASNRAEAERERVRAIVDTVSDCIITIYEEGSIKAFNPAAEMVFGYKESYMIGKNISLLMPSPYSEQHDSYLKNYFKTGVGKLLGREDMMTFRRELVGKRWDGSTFPMELSLGVSNVAGAKMFTGVVRDISKQKQIEQLKKNFVSSVSHELRTPLTAIKGSVGLISAGVADLPPNEKMATLLDVTNRNIDRLTNLINDLLDFEKLEADMLELTLEPTNVNDLISEAVTVNQHYSANSKITLIVTNHLNASINIDKNRINQVMANLISNAIKFSPEGGVVKIGAKRKNGQIHIFVSDDGPGVPEEFQSRIFDRFTQADSSDQKKQGGTGLGMAISKAIVEKHHGEINLHSEPGKGATFFFEIPEYNAAV